MLCLIIKQQTKADAGSALIPESFPVRHVAVQHIGAHGLLQDGRSKQQHKASSITHSIAKMDMRVYNLYLVAEYGSTE